MDFATMLIVSSISVYLGPLDKVRLMEQVATCLARRKCYKQQKGSTYIVNTGFQEQSWRPVRTQDWTSFVPVATPRVSMVSHTSLQAPALFSIVMYQAMIDISRDPSTCTILPQSFDYPFTWHGSTTILLGYSRGCLSSFHNDSIPVTLRPERFTFCCLWTIAAAPSLKVRTHIHVLLLIMTFILYPVFVIHVSLFISFRTWSQSLKVHVHPFSYGSQLLSFWGRYPWPYPLPMISIFVWVFSTLISCWSMTSTLCLRVVSMSLYP